MKLRDQCKHGRWDAHGVRPSRNNPKPTRCPGGRLVDATPIPQCATHGLPISQFGYDDHDMKPTECVGIVMGWHGDCQLEEPQSVYRIEDSNEC